MERRICGVILRWLAALAIGVVVACADQEAPRGGQLGEGIERDASSSMVDAGSVPDGAAAGDAMVAGGIQANCAAVVQEVLLTCGSIVCHDPFSGGIGTSLDLSDPEGLPERLIGLRATDACGRVPYIDVDQPAQSLLVRKLDTNPPCGERMPAGDRPPLDVSQRTCLLEWITAAALQARSDR